MFGTKIGEEVFGKKPFTQWEEDRINNKSKIIEMKKSERKQRKKGLKRRCIM